MFKLLTLLLIIPRLGLSSVAIQSETVPVRPGQVAIYQNDWIVAHNTLDGMYWHELEIGDDIIFGGISYKVEDVYRFQAVEPLNPAGDMLHEGERLTPQETMDMVRCDGCLVLQTCIGNKWGRLFVVAKPYSTIRTSR